MTLRLLLASPDFTGFDQLLFYPIESFFVGLCLAGLLWFVWPRSRYFCVLNGLVGFIVCDYLLWEHYDPFLVPRRSNLHSYSPNVAHSYPITDHDNLREDSVFTCRTGEVEKFKTDAQTVAKIVNAYQLIRISDSTIDVPWVQNVTYGWYLRNMLSDSGQLDLLEGPVQLYAVDGQHTNALLVYFPKTEQCLFQSFYSR